MRQFIWCALMFGLLSNGAYSAEPIRQKVSPHDCDSEKNSEFADLVFGPNKWGMVHLQLPWLSGDSIAVMRVNSSLIQGLVEFPFESDRVMWFDKSDSAEIVTIRAIDSVSLFYDNQSLAPTWYDATYCAVLRSSEASDTRVEILQLDATALAGGVIYSGQRPRLESVECIDSLENEARVLALEFGANNVMTGEEAAVLGLWNCHGPSFQFLTALPLYVYRNRPDVYSLGTTRTYSDVDHDGKREFVLQCSGQWGAGQASKLRDSVAVAYRLVRTHGDSALRWGFVPSASVLSNGELLGLRLGQIGTVFFDWDTVLVPLITSEEKTVVERLNQRIASLFQTENDVPSTETMLAKYTTLGREATAVVSAWLSIDSVHFELSIHEDSHMSMEPSTAPPSYDALLWIDPRHPRSVQDSVSRDSCLLVRLFFAEADGSCGAQVYTIVDESGNCDFVLVESRNCSFERLSGFAPYKYAFTMSRKQVGLTTGDPVAISCGFAVEVVSHSFMVCDEDQSRSRSEKYFSRTNPATWGNLILGVREDLVDNHRRNQIAE